jgi:dolichyl-phosphate-mannose--protein O-mannosyl transferase
MATFNWNVQGSSAMSSRPLTWIFDATPIWYRWALSPHGVVGMIAIGNPLLVAVLYLPWLLTSRQSYIYYLTPAIPFLAIVVATAGARLAGPAPLRGRWAATFFVAGAVVMGVAAGGTLAVRLAAPAALAAVLVAVALAARRRGERLPRPGAVAAWLYTGAVAGLAAAWLPFLVSYAASFGYYERLTWLAVWR